MGFLRFVVDRKDSDSAKPQGVFALAYELIESGELEHDQHDRLTLALVWFHIHLPLPDRSKISPRGIFWYKAHADELVRRMWEIVKVVESSGHAIGLIRTGKPGYILYEDEFQICAVPFRDSVNSVRNP